MVVAEVIRPDGFVTPRERDERKLAARREQRVRRGVPASRLAKGGTNWFSPYMIDYSYRHLIECILEGHIPGYCTKHRDLRSGEEVPSAWVWKSEAAFVTVAEIRADLSRAYKMVMPTAIEACGLKALSLIGPYDNYGNTTGGSLFLEKLAPFQGAPQQKRYTWAGLAHAWATTVPQLRAGADTACEKIALYLGWRPGDSGNA